jgi:methylmalonyl-CoA/ethylmalonyl-CoA epimerase
MDRAGSTTVRRMPDPTIPPAAAPRALAHVSIAVEDAEATAARYASLFGATVRSRERLDDRGLVVVLLDLAGVPIELVQPVDPADGTNPVARFLKTRGPGLHHLAWFVDDAQAALDHARQQDARLVDEKPRPGADGCAVAFLHPGSTAGVLHEYVAGGRHAPRPRGSEGLLTD